jgi:hypothetical protein
MQTLHAGGTNLSADWTIGLYAAGQRDDIWTLAPRYSRRNAAEEKWDSKVSGAGKGAD